MRSITVSGEDKGVLEILGQAHGENLIVRTPDGIEFILAEIDDFNREIELTRENAELMDLLDQRARKSDTLSLSDVKRRLGLDDES